MPKRTSISFRVPGTLIKHDNGQLEIVGKDRIINAGNIGKTVNRMVSTANKRLSRLVKLEADTGFTSPALRSFRNRTGKQKFSAAGDFNTKVATIAQINYFMDLATSTVTGARNNLQKTMEVFNIPKPDNVRQGVEELSTAMAAFEAVQQYFESVEMLGETLGSFDMRDAVSQAIEAGRIDITDRQQALMDAMTIAQELMLESSGAERITNVNGDYWVLK